MYHIQVCYSFFLNILVFILSYVLDKGLVPYHAGYVDSYGITDTYSDCFWYYVIHVMYLCFVFDICFMTNTFIISMTVSTSMVLHMYGYMENKEMNEWMKSLCFLRELSHTQWLKVIFLLFIVNSNCVATSHTLERLS